MMKELFDLLFQNAVNASAAKVTAIDGDPTRVLVSANGKHEFETLPNYRDHVVDSLQSMLDAIGVWCKEGTIWHSEGRVIAVTDDNERREQITLPLHKSDQFMTISGLTKDGVDQRSAIRLLRHDLDGCTDGTLLSLVRKVEFKSSSSSRGDIDRGKESLGRAVDAAINVADSLPDRVIVTVPVYKTAGVNHRVDIACSLDVNLQTERFVLLPLPNQLQDAVDSIQDDLHAALSELKVPVFYGSP